MMKDSSCVAESGQEGERREKEGKKGKTKGKEEGKIKINLQNRKEEGCLPLYVL